MYKLGLDIGGTKINIGILDEESELVCVRRVEIASVTDAIADIKRNIKELCEENGIETTALICCGIGVPGTVSEDGKKLIKAPNIAVLSEDFAIRLEEELGIPTVMVQDSRAAAYGEYSAGAGVGAKTLICFTLGTGIGTGIVIDGKIYNGALGAAGELGHIPVVDGGRECGCGKLGCLEKYAAGRGLDITAAELFGKGNTAHRLFREAGLDNKIAKGKIDEAIRLLGNAIVSAINLLSPDKILFSGGLAEQTELYLYPLIDYVKEHCYSAGELPVMEKAALSEYSPWVGAALCACTKA